MDSEIPSKLPRFHTIFPPKDQDEQTHQEKFPVSPHSTPPSGHSANIAYSPPGVSDSQSPLLSSSVTYPERTLYSVEHAENTTQPTYSPLLNNSNDMYSHYSANSQPATPTDTHRRELNATEAEPDVKPFSQAPPGDGWQFTLGRSPAANPFYPDDLQKQLQQQQQQQQLGVSQAYQQRVPLSLGDQYSHDRSTMSEEQLHAHQLSEAFMKDMCAWLKRQHDSQQLSTFNMNMRSEDRNEGSQASASTSRAQANISQGEHPTYRPSESQSPFYSFSSLPTAGGSPWYFPHSQMSLPPGVLAAPNSHLFLQNSLNINAMNGRTVNYGHPALSFPKSEEESRTACSNTPSMRHSSPFSASAGYAADFMNTMNRYVPTGPHPMSSHQYVESSPYYRPLKTEPGYCYMGPNDKNLRGEPMYGDMVPSSYSMNNYNTNQHRPIYSNASVKLEAKSKEPSDVYEFYDDCPSPTVHFSARHRLNRFPNGRIDGYNQKSANDESKVLTYVSCDPADDLALTSGSEFTSRANQFLYIEQNLCEALSKLSFSEPVTNIYNPLSYAGEPHRNFVMRFCKSNKDVLFLSLNPGPFGMAQNGVPFGESTIVREWFKIEGAVHKPSIEHPRRQVSGLQNTRKEVSGARFWGFFQRVCETPECFFQHCFVHTMCPLVFMAKSGKNVTSSQMAVAQRRPLHKVCDHAFLDVVRLLGVKIVVGIGKYAQERATEALRDASLGGIRVECIMHPSPANPAANKGWDSIVEKQLQDIDVLKYFQAEKSVKKEEGSP